MGLVFEILYTNVRLHSRCMIDAPGHYYLLPLT